MLIKDDQMRLHALSHELDSLRSQRNALCDRFMSKGCDVPLFCIQLDAIGKKFADNCLFASIYNESKFFKEIWCSSFNHPN